MATYRAYKKKDGMFSVTATIRRKGYNPWTATFTGRTRKEAQDDAAAWAADIEQRMHYKRVGDPRSARVRLADAFELYFEHLELTGRKRASTIQGERWSRNQLVAKLGENTYLADITTARMAQYRDDRLSEGVGASKIRSEIALVSSLFRYAMQEKGLPLENPVSGDKLWRPKAPKGKTTFLTEQQIGRLIEECRKTTSRGGKLPAYVLVMLQTGMRPGEAALLKVNMIDVKKRSLKLDLTKNGDERLIQLTDNAFRELAKHMLGKKPTDYIFFDGDTLPKNYVKRPASLFRGPYDKARERAGLSWVTRHDLRHTAATHLLKAGVELRLIAEALGHRTLQMAMKYTHPDVDIMRETWGNLNDLGVFSTDQK